METYSQPTTGTVFFTLSAGGVTKSMSFKNKENIQLEMHTMNIVTKEKYSNINGIIIYIYRFSYFFNSR